jgi:hypothetical protein
VTDLVLIGAGKFSLEVARWIDDVTASGRRSYRVRQHLTLPGEPVHAPAPLCVPLADFDPPAGTRVVLALSDLPQRTAAIDGFITKHGLVAENIVHPTARVDAAALGGVGNVIGPHCYLGVNVSLGSYNTLNYFCTVGHHSRLGSNNFISPNFNCGNTVTIGDGNLFGLSCTLAPAVTVGDDSAFQAGIAIFEDTASGCSYLVPSRIKMLKRF